MRREQSGSQTQERPQFDGLELGLGSIQPGRLLEEFFGTHLVHDLNQRHQCIDAVVAAGLETSCRSFERVRQQ